MDQFHGPPSPGCESLGWVGSCRNPVKCNTHADSGPASYIISSSVVAVYNIFNTLDAAFSAHISDGVDNFGAPFGFKAEKLTKTSQEDKDKLVSVMLDTSQIATLAAIAPSINISISESRYTRTNDTLRNHLFETTMSIVAPDLKELLKSTNISDTNE